MTTRESHDHHVIAYLCLDHIAALSPHSQDGIENVDFPFVFNRLHHGLDGDQRSCPAYSSTLQRM